MKIFIVGLGLIGASYAEGLKKCGHSIYAYNRSQSVIKKAKQDKIIESDNDISYLSKADLIILSLYPIHNIEFIKKHKHLLKPNQIITDVSGTKVEMIPRIIAELPDFVSYTSHHPMAGKEISGYDAKDANLFKDANFIIVKTSKSDNRDENVLRSIAKDLKFDKITVTTPKIHDQLIAYTSQLTHVIAVSLVNSNRLEDIQNATGDSYRDLTRIAKINEVMWTELFLENKDALLNQMMHFESELKKLRLLIQSNDQQKIKSYLKKAKETRIIFDEVTNENI